MFTLSGRQPSIPRVLSPTHPQQRQYGGFRDGVQRMARYLACTHTSQGSLAISYFKICKLERHKGKRHSVPNGIHCYEHLLYSLRYSLPALLWVLFPALYACVLSWNLTRLHSLKILGYRCCSGQKWFVFVLTVTWYTDLMSFFNMAFLIYLLDLPLLETLIFFNFWKQLNLLQWIFGREWFCVTS